MRLTAVLLAAFAVPAWCCCALEMMVSTQTDAAPAMHAAMPAASCHGPAPASDSGDLPLPGSGACDCPQIAAAPDHDQPLLVSAATQPLPIAVTPLPAAMMPWTFLPHHSPLADRPARPGGADSLVSLGCLLTT